jgi:hypothetical protein
MCLASREASRASADESIPRELSLFDAASAPSCALASTAAAITGSTSPTRPRPSRRPIRLDDSARVA